MNARIFFKTLNTSDPPSTTCNFFSSSKINNLLKYIFIVHEMINYIWINKLTNLHKAITCIMRSKTNITCIAKITEWLSMISSNGWLRTTQSKALEEMGSIPRIAHTTKFLWAFPIFPLSFREKIIYTLNIIMYWN